MCDLNSDTGNLENLLEAFQKELRNVKYQQLLQKFNLTSGSKHNHQVHQHNILAIKVHFKQRQVDLLAHSAKVIICL